MLVFGRRIHWPTVAAAAVAILLVQLPTLSRESWSITLSPILPLFVGWVAGRKEERRRTASPPASFGAGERTGTV